MKAQKTPLKDARIMFYGAGSSAVGVAQSIASYIHLKGDVPKEEADKVREPKTASDAARDHVQAGHAPHVYTWRGLA